LFEVITLFSGDCQGPDVHSWKVRKKEAVSKSHSCWILSEAAWCVQVTSVVETEFLKGNIMMKLVSSVVERSGAGIKCLA